MFRRTRLVCISDTHNASPDGSFKLPAGDVLIHAGDLTNQGRYDELRKTFDWISKTDFEVKIVIAGNHDITLDQAFYEESGDYHHGQHLQDAEVCRKLMEQYPSITFLHHESVEVTLLKPGGPRTSFKVFGSPYSPARVKFRWMPTLSLRIRLRETTVINQKIAGRLAVKHCGKLYRSIVWDMHSHDGNFKEEDVGYWVDPGFGNKKQCLVDLSSRSPQPLQGINQIQKANSGTKKSKGPLMECWTWKSEIRGLYSEQCSSPAIDETHLDKTAVGVAGTGATLQQSCLLDEKEQPAVLEDRVRKSTTDRPKRDALQGRLGRRETCVVNAAIMATSWPHKAVNGSKYNKPIVVDLDLPTSTSLD
ncbi:MAG: hypothetical protein Q9176_002736 [Flavoplaca citrina]